MKTVRTAQLKTMYKVEQRLKLLSMLAYCAGTALTVFFFLLGRRDLLVLLGLTVSVVLLAWTLIGTARIGWSIGAVPPAAAAVLPAAISFLSAHRLSGVRLPAWILLGLSLLVWLIFGFCFWRMASACRRTGKTVDAHSVILIPGAQIVGHGPGPTLQRRLDRAVELYQAHPGLRLIVSGACVEGRVYTEAQIMQEYLQNRGIPAKQIHSEDRSENTAENFRYCVPLIRQLPAVSSVFILTSDYHMYRCRRLAAQYGLPASPIAVRSCRAEKLVVCCREACSILWQFYLGKASDQDEK